MKKYIIGLFILVVINNTVFGKVMDNIGIGVGIGGQKLYCDIPATGYGLGIETYVKYTFVPRFSTSLALGYGEFSDGTFRMDESTFTTKAMIIDFKGTFHPIPDFFLNPSVYMGIGALNFYSEKLQKRFPFEGTYFWGGGIEYKISPRIGLAGYFDYHYTDSDDLDDSQRAKEKDGFLNLKAGMTYYFESQEASGTKLLAEEKAPIEEIGDNYNDEEDTGEKELSALLDGVDQYEEGQDSDKQINTYVQLKSRLGELTDKISQKELEIEELKSQLDYRQGRISELENTTKGISPSPAMAADVNYNDFSSNYKKALELYYARDYDASIYILSSLIKVYPNHSLASNCYYWIGESYFGKADYKKAIESFSKVFNYSNSSKGDDALIMLGRSYLKLGQPQLANKMFNRLVNEYPDSEYYTKADAYLKD